MVTKQLLHAAWFSGFRFLTVNPVSACDCVFHRSYARAFRHAKIAGSSVHQIPEPPMIKKAVSRKIVLELLLLFLFIPIFSCSVPTNDNFGWIDLTLYNGWQNTNAASVPAAQYKKADGLFRFRGDIIKYPFQDENWIFDIPPEAQSTVSRIFPVMAFKDDREPIGTGYLIIWNSGMVQLYGVPQIAASMRVCFEFAFSE